VLNKELRFRNIEEHIKQSNIKKVKPYGKIIEKNIWQRNPTMFEKNI